MSELTFAPSFRFDNAMEFCLLRMLALAGNRSDKDEEERAPGWNPAPLLQQLMFATCQS